MKELLKQIIFEQQDNCRHLMQDAIPRHIEEEWLTTSEILIITGVRRCGKSVLLQQLRDKLEEKDFFFNFDDERLVNFKLLQPCRNASLSFSVSSTPITLMRFKTLRVGKPL